MACVTQMDWNEWRHEKGTREWEEITGRVIVCVSVNNNISHSFLDIAEMRLLREKYPFQFFSVYFLIFIFAFLFLLPLTSSILQGLYDGT